MITNPNPLRRTIKMENMTKATAEKVVKEKAKRTQRIRKGKVVNGYVISLEALELFMGTKNELVQCLSGDWS
ncbi:hypothetical protein LCGC14_0775480 [marine sediment metagenome]|uniref:Uncharacterized protein n=1 Tax=marine sediment metagenome TaxID=412755 RepID=A0A0F9T401_9ZZZZ